MEWEVYVPSSPAKKRQMNIQILLKETYYQNYGVEYAGTQNVHIDHIVPLSTAKTEKDVYRLCHYTNLQLLNAKDNLRKSDKLDFVL